MATQKINNNQAKQANGDAINQGTSSLSTWIRIGFCVSLFALSFCIYHFLQFTVLVEFWLPSWIKTLSIFVTNPDRQSVDLGIKKNPTSFFWCDLLGLSLCHHNFNFKFSYVTILSNMQDFYFNFSYVTNCDSQYYPTCKTPCLSSLASTLCNILCLFYVHLPFSVLSFHLLSNGANRTNRNLSAFLVHNVHNVQCTHCIQ